MANDNRCMIVEKESRVLVVAVDEFREFEKERRVLDYTVDWTKWLDEVEDTIATSTWIVPTGLTKVTETNTTKLATVWLSGGTVGTNYTVTNRITTVGGRIDDRSITIRVRER